MRARTNRPMGPGFLLFSYQLMTIGLHHIPPVTLAVVFLCIAVYFGDNSVLQPFTS